MTLESRNPATGELLRAYPEATDEDVAAALRQADAAFGTWRLVPVADRGRRVTQLGVLLRERVDALARMMALEMGKPLAQGRSEVEKCAATCDYYAAEAAGFLEPRPVPTEAQRSFVTFQPLGVILAVMPWNFPLWQVFRFAAPALMAGNTAVLKHASNVTGCALAIEDLVRDAGFPEGALRTLLIGSPRVAAVIAAPEVKAVTLTGSTPAGRAVASQAGQHLKKTVLELGGSDAYVVLADADLEQAAESCVTSRLINAGQSCIAAKRFIVVQPALARFEELFVQKMAARRMGDPLQPGIDVGPQARHDLRDDLHRQVQSSIAAGARLRLGGSVPDGPGAFYPPTVLSGVTPGMAAWDEELFGPVAAIAAARDEDHALQLANASVFGLGAAVFTADVARGQRIAAEVLEAGCCFVNDFVRSDPRLPFGGVKESGYGRELSSFGLHEFVNVKTVWVR